MPRAGPRAVCAWLAVGGASALLERESMKCFRDTNQRDVLTGTFPYTGESPRLCFYGHCIADCGDCGNRCGLHGRCFARPANDTRPPLGTNPDGLSLSFGYERECEAGARCETSRVEVFREVGGAGIDVAFDVPHPDAKDGCCHGSALYEELPPVDQQVPENNEYIRYCNCDPGWLGSHCEFEMIPSIPWLYMLAGLAFTTLMALKVVGAKAFLDFGSSERVFKDELIDREGNPAPLKMTGIILVWQYFLMGCGSFCYSIAWTDNFPLIIVLRFVSDIMMGAFEVLADLILPENWTSNDAQTVKMTLAVSVPAFLIAYCLVHATPHPKTGRRMFTYAGSFIIYTLLPMITIPVVGTLFRPIVGCHFDAPWMDPVPLRPEDESTRAAPIEMQFQPVHLRHDCAFGDKTETYFDLGVGLMIPFWAIGLFLGSQGSTERMLFPVHKGFHVLHTQLMVVVAMAYRAFKMRHPMNLSLSLVVINALEIVLILVFRPNDHRPINTLRLHMASISTTWAVCAVLAQLINDRDSVASAIVLTGACLAWVGVVIAQKRRGSASRDGSAETEMHAVEESDQ